MGRSARATLPVAVSVPSPSLNCDFVLASSIGSAAAHARRSRARNVRRRPLPRCSRDLPNGGRSTSTSLSESKRKLMLGCVGGGGVRFGSPSREEAYVVGEGIESTLSAMRLWGLSCGCAALSAPGLENLLLPADVNLVVIAADNDVNLRGQRAANRARSRWKAEGRQVRVRLPKARRSRLQRPAVGEDRAGDARRERHRPRSGRNRTRTARQRRRARTSRTFNSDQSNRGDDAGEATKLRSKSGTPTFSSNSLGEADLFHTRNDAPRTPT